MNSENEAFPMIFIARSLTVDRCKRKSCIVVSTNNNYNILSFGCNIPEISAAKLFGSAIIPLSAPHLTWCFGNLA